MLNLMYRKKQAGCIGLLLAAAIAVAGCGRGGSSTGSKSLDRAAPEIKAAWDKAVAADRANDYAPAVTGYKQILLQRDQLSPAQLKVVESAYGKLMQRLMEAAGKGDLAARQALTVLTPTRPRGQMGTR